jgi:hypothetical protein
MKLIAHRGLLDGPDPHRENHPSAISSALSQGFDAEIDVWLMGNTPMLGHDQAQYVMPTEWFLQPGLWIHAKNFEAANWLIDLHLTAPHLNFFWHDNDSRTLTSQGFWWTYPGQQLGKYSIAVMPEWHQKDLKSWAESQHCYGICTDYPRSLQT